MILDENHIEQFERHARGLMDEQEQDQFEDLLRNNEGIRNEYYVYSDIFDDLDIIADEELKQNLNDIHNNFNTDYINKENRIKKIYYGLGLIFFALILFSIYMFGVHHPEMQIQEKENVPQLDSNRTTEVFPSNKNAKKVNSTKSEAINEEEIITIVKTSTQEISIIEYYIPSQSYSFSEKGLQLYGIDKKEVKTINLIKDKGLFFLNFNGAYYPIVTTDENTVALVKTKSPLKTITHGKKGREIPIQYFPTLERLSDQVVSITFENDFKEDEVQLKSDVLHLSERHLPVKSVKRQNDLSLLLQTEKGSYIFNKNSSPKLQVWKDKKTSLDYIVLLERNWENDYLNENAQ